MKRIQAYKRVLVVIGILLSLLALSGCNATKKANKKFQKAVNKFGQKEAANFIVSNYPEYFKTITKKDTLFHVDTVYITEKDGVIVDPVILRDTIYIKTKDFSANISKTTGKGTYKIPRDTIYIKDTIPFEVKVPCPDADLLALKSNKELELEIKNTKQNANFYKLGLALLVVLGIILGYIYYKNKPESHKI